MKKIVIILAVIMGLGIAENASAIEYSNSGIRGMYKLELGTSGGTVSSATIPNSYSLSVNAPTLTSGATLYTINPQLMEGLGIPANSIALFNIRMLVPAYANNFEFGGFQGVSNGSIVDYNCVTNVYINNDRVADMTCALWVFYPSYTENTVIRTQTFYRAAGLNVAVNGVGYVTLKSGSGDVTVSDLETQIDRLTRLIPEQTDRIVTIERQIRELLENIEASQGEALEEALANEREAEKEEYEDQQEDVDSGAEDAGAEAEEQTSNLITTAGNIITAIRDTPATNCVIRVQRGAFDTGNIDLCSQVPQTIRTVISTIITIPVTLAALHIIYTTVMLYLDTVRKEQE